MFIAGLISQLARTLRPDQAFPHLVRDDVLGDAEGPVSTYIEEVEEAARLVAGKISAWRQ